MSTPIILKHFNFFENIHYHILIKKENNFFKLKMNGIVKKKLRNLKKYF